MKEAIKTVKMFGPSISDPSKIVNRDVPEVDIQAYVAAGYQKGSVPEAEKPVVDVEAPKIAKGKSK